MQEQFPSLSTSATAQWRLVTYVVAVAVYSFELILDLFQTEMEEKTQQITPGTVRWYAEMCRRFQNGHELVFDPTTAMYGYPTLDTESQIVGIVAVSDKDTVLSIKVAKIEDDKVTPFTAEELQDFTGYIESIHTIGTQYAITSTTPDIVQYDIEVFYDSNMPRATIEQDVLSALETYKSSIGFDGTLYSQRFIEEILNVSGVLTVDCKGLKRKGATDSDYTEVGVWSELHAGYFEYDDNNTLTLTSK